MGQMNPQLMQQSPFVMMGQPGILLKRFTWGSNFCFVDSCWQPGKLRRCNRSRAKFHFYCDQNQSTLIEKRLKLDQNHDRLLGIRFI